MFAGCCKRLGKSGQGFCRASPLLRTLHWFPISLGVNAKVLTRPYTFWLQDHKCRSPCLCTHTHTHTRTPHLLDTAPTALPVPLFSSHTCVPGTHQVHAHLRVCSFCSLCPSLSSLPSFLHNSYHLWTHCLIYLFLFVSIYSHWNISTMKAGAFLVLFTVVYPV